MHYRGDKARSQRRHALRRAAERYGLSLTESDMASILQQITSGRARLVEKQSNRVSLYEVEILRDNLSDLERRCGGLCDPEVVTALVCHDKFRNEISSFLPR
jgi:hypothetical protein